MKEKIKVIDSPMGAGKTSYLIQMIKRNTENKYMFITPFLDEVDRIITTCKENKFSQPTNKAKNGSKLESLKKLVSKGKNVVSTHALFSIADEELIKLIKSQGYILILDEVMDVVSSADIKKSDIEMLFNENKIKVEEPYNKVIWLDEKYDGKFNNIKNMANNDSLYYVNKTLMVWSLPVSIFDCFEEVFISTYMFDAQIQKYYYDYFEMEYEYYHIERNINDYKIVKTISFDYDNEFKKKAKSLINIIDNEKLNAIGDSYGTGKYKTALSKTWYYKNKDNDLIKTLKKNMTNFFRNYCEDKSELNMWTTFNDYKQLLKGKGYTKGFIPCNSRATNQYSHKKNCAYVINRYINPFYESFFTQRGITIDQDKYALSEMLQWIWRSAIRNNEPINVYIPSVRMRNLLVTFLS